MMYWQTTYESALWMIERSLRQRYGIDQAERDLDPLAWYVRTGRASTEFIKRLASAKPFMVARRLQEGGSYEDAIRRVKKLIGYTEEV